MPKRRVFIAINFPDNFKKQIVTFQEKWHQLPVRWIKPENLHLTIVPPMHLTDDEIGRLVSAVKEVVNNFEPFEIEFEKFIYAPPGKSIRMIWLDGKRSEELTQLKTILGGAILKAGIPFREEARPLRVHITVARMREDEWRHYEPKPDIEEAFSGSAPISGVEIMESVLKRGGAEYTLLESIPLQK